MYDPTSRVLTVLGLLQSKPGMSGPEIASHLETDVRTVRRYIMKLQDAGIPVEATPGRYGGYRLRPGYKLPPLIFTEEEATSIVLGLLGSSWNEQGQSKAAVEGALSKIARVMPEETRKRLETISSDLYLFPRSWETFPDVSLFLDLSESVQLRRCVEIDYSSRAGETTHRIVEPYGLAERYGRWYLVGFCRMRFDYRTFRLDRISALRVLDQTFKRDESFNYRAYVTEHLESMPTKWQLRIEFAADMATLKKRFPAAYGTLTETPNGVRFEGPADDLDEAARYLMLVGLPFVVKEPPELRDAMRRLAEEAARIAALGAPGSST